MPKTKIILKDSEEIQNIIIQVDSKNNTTKVISNFSAWGNLALIMEGLGVTAEKCLQEGIERQKVYEEIKEYLLKVLVSYKIIEYRSIE